MRAVILMLLGAGAAIGQLNDDTVTVLAGSTIFGLPDKAPVTVCVAAELGKGFDEVLSAVSAAGVTERDFTYAQPANGSTSWGCPWVSPGSVSYVYWNFSVWAPLSKLKETLAALAGLPRSPKPGLVVNYAIGNPMVSSTVLAECAVPTLMAQARRHAENLAAAAGRQLGSIRAMSDGTDIADPVTFTVTVPSTVVSRIPTDTLNAPTCVLAVEFKLLR